MKKKATVYKRPDSQYYWMRFVHQGQDVRKSTGEVDRKKAESVAAFAAENYERTGGKVFTNIPRILMLDIETAPIEGYMWTFFPNFVDPMSQVVKNPDGKPKDWSILTYAAKWLFEADVHYGMVSLKEAEYRYDASIMQGLWDLFEEADVIVGHNGDKFDIRRCNYRFAINGYGPASPFQTIDTKKVAKKAFGVPSYKQDYLNRDFELSRKIHTEFELWERCVSGDQSGLDEMLRYNIQDVYGLEDLYIKLRPWIRGPVNLAMYGENNEKQCHNCFGTKLKLLSKPYTTPAGQYEAYRCMSCGAIGRERYIAKSIEQRKNSILPTAR